MINRSVCTFKTKLFDIERIYPVMSKKNNSKQSKEQDKPSKEVCVSYLCSLLIPYKTFNF